MKELVSFWCHFYVFSSQLTRDLDHCHDELRRLNTLLAEKKEYVLKYQEKISDHQSEIVALKQDNTAMKQEISALKQRQALSNQVAPPSMSHDSALQSQVWCCIVHVYLLQYLHCFTFTWIYYHPFLFLLLFLLSSFPSPSLLFSSLLLPSQLPSPSFLSPSPQ